MEISAAVVRSFDHPPRRPSGSRPTPSTPGTIGFVADDELTGPMATRTVVDARRCIPLPDGVDVVKVAAAMNPAMSSWVALRRRVPIRTGQSVLVLGATGNAGQMAIQIGAMAGPTIELPSVALRSANFRLQGNGQGAVSTRAYLEELPPLVEEIDHGGIAVTARAHPLADVESVWTAPEVPGVRTVLVTGKV